MARTVTRAQIHILLSGDYVLQELGRGKTYEDLLIETADTRKMTKKEYKDFLSLQMVKASERTH